jgi:kumamolisin
MKPRFVIPGSEAGHTSGGSWLPVSADQKISPTIIIRRPPGALDISQQLLSGSWRPMSREQAENLLRVDPADLAAVLSFARANGLQIIAQNAEARTVQIEGTTTQIGEAFGVDIQWRVAPKGQKYLSYQGALTLPAELSGIVEAVLGLDQRPIARHSAGA